MAIAHGQSQMEKTESKNDKKYYMNTQPMQANLPMFLVDLMQSTYVNNSKQLFKTSVYPLVSER